jgi:uncharacterized protein
MKIIETHFAWVFLTGRYALKLKKAVRRGRMDYRSVAARRRICRDELILNRRLAPTVYLGVLPVVRARNGTLTLGKAGRDRGRIVDWMVAMRRLRAGRMLDRALLAGSVRTEDLVRVAARLSRFFEFAVRQTMSAEHYVERLSARITQDRLDLCASDLGLDSRLIAEIAGRQLAFLAEQGECVGARAQYLIDGHGDLRPEHIYLGSRSEDPCVIDCLEFDAELRWLDPAEEMAFLALECRLLGAARAARILLRQYCAATLEPPSEALLDFYTSLSAMTRAKLAAWHLREPSYAPQATVWRARAQRYLGQAYRSSQRALHRPTLQQRRERLPGQYTLDCLTEQRRD